MMTTTPLTVKAISTTPLGELMPNIWYPGMLPDTPDLLVLKLPPTFAPFDTNPVSASIKVTFVETAADREAVQDALKRPLSVRGNVVNFRVSIDIPNMRPSSFRPSSDLGNFLHAPDDAVAWPHIVVAMMPRNAPGRGLCRERYGWDAFATKSAALEQVAKFAAKSIIAGVKPRT